MARWGAELFSELEVPVTWYVTGKTLEKYPEAFQEAAQCPQIDLQSHTYSHILLKTVLLQVPPGREIHGATDWYLRRGGSLEEIEADLAKCQGIFREVLGAPATALTGPWNYYRGLGDRPDLLEIVDRLGFRALRTFGRDEHDGQPVPLAWQPFFYRVQGFPHLLEIMIHDYQDDFSWEAFAAPKPGETYLEHLKSVADQVAREDLVWSMASHDHGCATLQACEERKGWWRGILRYCRELGFRFLTVSQFYQERILARS